MSVIKREAKDIEKMIQRQNEIQTTQKNPEISYQDSCEYFKFYKSKTLKINVDDADYNQNLAFRQFFLNIKKRYDVRFRAQKFRVKKKREIENLKIAAQACPGLGTELKEDTQLGKRDPIRPIQPEEIIDMRRKIQKLEQQLQNQDKEYENLLQSKEKNSSEQANFINDNITQCSIMKTHEPKMEKLSVCQGSETLSLNSDSEGEFDPNNQSLDSNIEINSNQQTELLIQANKETFTDQQIIAKKQEINKDQLALRQHIKEMLESQIIFAQLRNQPTKLMKKIDGLKKEMVNIQHQVAVIQNNYSNTVAYLKNEESTQKVNQDQILQFDKQITMKLKQLEQLIRIKNFQKSDPEIRID